MLYVYTAQIHVGFSFGSTCNDNSPGLFLILTLDTAVWSDVAVYSLCSFFLFTTSVIVKSFVHRQICLSFLSRPQLDSLCMCSPGGVGVKCMSTKWTRMLISLLHLPNASYCLTLHTCIALGTLRQIAELAVNLDTELQCHCSCMQGWPI